MIRVDVTFYDKADVTVIANLGGAVVDHLEFIPNVLIVQIPEDKLEELRANPLVKAVDLEQWLPSTGSAFRPERMGKVIIESVDANSEEVIPDTTSDASWNKGHSINNAYPDYSVFNYDKLYLRVKDFWDRGFTGKGIKVGVIDACGVNHMAIDVKDGIWYDPSFTNYTTQSNYHSTSCSYVLAGRPVFGQFSDANDDYYTVNMSGVAYDAELYIGCAGSATAGDATNTSYATSCLNWMIGKKVQVVSCSWNGGAYNASFEAALNAAYNAGIAVVVAAGNTGTSDATLEQGAFPSNLTNAIAVAGFQESKTRWLGTGEGSSTSATNMFTGPGNNVPSAYYNNSGTRSNGTYMFGGSSCAAPVVAGMIALYKQALPDKTLPQILSIMQNNCYTFGKTGRNKEYGYGMPQPSPEIMAKPLMQQPIGLKMDVHSTYIQVPSGTLIDDLVDNFTLELTVTQPQGSGCNGIIRWDPWYNYQAWGFWMDYYTIAYYGYSDNNQYGTQGYGYGAQFYTDTRIGNRPMTWHVVYNYPSIQIYIDGALQYTGTMSGHMLSAKSGSTYSPDFYIAKYLNGIFHKARIYNRSLSATDVANINLGSRIKNGLVLEYIATGKETNQILDTSGNGFHGTIAGAATSNVKRIN